MPTRREALGLVGAAVGAGLIAGPGGAAAAAMVLRPMPEPIKALSPGGVLTAEWFDELVVRVNELSERA